MQNVFFQKKPVFKKRETGPVIKKTTTRLPQPQRILAIDAKKVVFQG